MWAGWPKDAPFQVLTYCPAAKVSNQRFELNVGDKGRVVSQSRDDQNAIQVEMNGFGSVPGLSAWIDKRYVDIGTIRSVRQGFELEVTPPRVPEVGLTAAAFTGANHTLLSSTISALLQTWLQYRDEFPVEIEWLEKELSSAQQIPNYTKDFVQGMGRACTGIRNLFLRGNFTITDVLNAGRPLQSSPNGDKGIYWLIVDHGSDAGTKRYNLYTGSTGASFNNRYAGYRSEIDNGEEKARPVIRAIRKALETKGEWFMIPICSLTGAGAGRGDPKTMLAEQIFTDLGQTYTSETLNFGRGADFSSADDVRTSISTTRPDEKMAEVVSNYGYARKVLCSFMQRLASKTFAVTGWNGCCLRRNTPTQAAPVPVNFGSDVGLNAQCPITEIRHCKTVWIRDRCPGYTTYRRSGYNVTERGEVQKVLFSKNGIKGTERFQVAVDKVKYPWPPVGTAVHVIFEIADDDKLSDQPLAQLPSVGGPSDWELANKIALRFEWLENGKWVGSYFQFRRPQIPRKKESPVIPPLEQPDYQKCVGMYHFFNQQVRTLSDAQREHMRDYGTARIKEMREDWLKQLLRVEDVDNTRKIPNPTLRSLATVGRVLMAPPYNLENAYQVNSGPGYGTFSRFTSANGSARNPRNTGRARLGCDGCHVINRQRDPGNPTEWLRNEAVPKCDRLDAEQICTRCKMYGRPCTFTPTQEFDDPDEAFKSLPDNHPKMRGLTSPFNYHGKFQGSPGNVVEIF